MKLINCDLGECLNPDPDSQIMPLIDMANIACGGHAGDEDSMIKTVLLAKQHHVHIGVHPSYPDKTNFGRVSQHVTEQELFDILIHQVSVFEDICQTHDAKLSYIKPHGALYHDMMTKPEVLTVLTEVVKVFNAELKLVVQAGIWSGADKHNDIELIYEAFADRTYSQNLLIQRSEGGALLEHPEAIVEQYRRFCLAPPFKIDTVCFHSDHPPSVNALNTIKGK